MVVVFSSFGPMNENNKSKLRTINFFLSGSRVPRLFGVYGLFQLLVEWRRIKMVVDMVGCSTSGAWGFQKSP